MEAIPHAILFACVMVLILISLSIYKPAENALVFYRLKPKMPALMIPENYKYAVLGAVVVPFVANMIIGGPVMAARKSMNVPYPNLYATPGVHDKADAFNRIQRGHQNMFETVRLYLCLLYRLKDNSS